jgi:hypothetical protein
LDRAVRNYFFAFLLFNLFFVYTIGGSFFIKVASITRSLASDLAALKVDNLLNANLSTFISLMGQSIPGQAFFFCNWVVTNSALSVSLSLLRPAAPIIYFIKKRFFCVTERDYRQLDAPPGEHLRVFFLGL